MSTARSATRTISRLAPHGRDGYAMKVTEEPIAIPLRQAEAGTPTAGLSRKLEITGTTFYRWKYRGLGVSKLRELKQLKEESQKLRQLVADQSLDRSILHKALQTLG